MTREQLMFLHDLLDGHHDEEWIISANIILAASGIAEQVSEMEPAEKIVRGFLQRLDVRRIGVHGKQAFRDQQDAVFGIGGANAGKFLARHLDVIVTE